MRAQMSNEYRCNVFMFFDFTIFEFFLSGDTHYEAYMHKKMVFMYNFKQLKYRFL